jgi:hypothetical protein
MRIFLKNEANFLVKTRYLQINNGKTLILLLLTDEVRKPKRALCGLK